MRKTFIKRDIYLKGPVRQKQYRKNGVRKRRVVGRIYRIKCSWQGHKDKNRRKIWIKRSGQARLVYVKDIDRAIPPREGGPVGMCWGAEECLHRKWSLKRACTHWVDSQAVTMTQKRAFVPLDGSSCLLPSVDWWTVSEANGRGIVHALQMTDRKNKKLKHEWWTKQGN